MPKSDNDRAAEPESKPNTELPDAPILSGFEVEAATPVPVGRYTGGQAEIGAVSVAVNTVWAWITGLRMRLKIQKDLGRKATDADLTSIDTWMKIDEVESRNEARNPPERR